MKKILLALSLASGLAFAQGPKQNKNIDTDQDNRICVDDGGVEKCLTVEGSTGNAVIDGVDAAARLELDYSNGSSNWGIESTTGDDFVVDRNATTRLRIDGSTGIFEATGDDSGNCTNGTICSGTSTPTCTVNTNLDSCSFLGMNWVRVGKYVSASFQALMDPTSTGDVIFQFIPPFGGGTYSSDDQASGSCVAEEPGGQHDAGFLRATGTQTNIRIRFAGMTVTTQVSVYCSFTYEIVP
jgi:hypothetical protein